MHYCGIAVKGRKLYKRPIEIHQGVAKMSFSSTAAEVKAKVEGGMRSVQPLGGDGQHVEAANTPDTSAPLISTPNAGEPLLRNKFVNKPTTDVFTDIGESVLP